MDKDYAPKAISIILLAGIGSAFIGPNIANISKGFISDHMYAGSYLALAALSISSIIFLFFFQAEDGIRDPLWSRGLGDVYKRQTSTAAKRY